MDLAAGHSESYYLWSTVRFCTVRILLEVSTVYLLITAPSTSPLLIMGIQSTECLLLSLPALSSTSFSFPFSILRRFAFYAFVLFISGVLDTYSSYPLLPIVLPSPSFSLFNSMLPFHVAIYIATTFIEINGNLYASATPTRSLSSQLTPSLLIVTIMSIALLISLQGGQWWSSSSSWWSWTETVFASMQSLCSFYLTGSYEVPINVGVLMLFFFIALYTFTYLLWQSHNVVWTHTPFYVVIAVLVQGVLQYVTMYTAYECQTFMSLSFYRLLELVCKLVTFFLFCVLGFKQVTIVEVVLLVTVALLSSQYFRMIRPIVEKSDVAKIYS